MKKIIIFFIVIIILVISFQYCFFIKEQSQPCIKYPTPFETNKSSKYSININEYEDEDEKIF